MPRWDLNKFTHVERTIGTSMKSVGEVVSICPSSVFSDFRCRWPSVVISKKRSKKRYAWYTVARLTDSKVEEALKQLMMDSLTLRTKESWSSPKLWAKVRKHPPLLSSKINFLFKATPLNKYANSPRLINGSCRNSRRSATSKRIWGLWRRRNCWLLIRCGKLRD